MNTVLAHSPRREPNQALHVVVKGSFCESELSKLRCRMHTSERVQMPTRPSATLGSEDLLSRPALVPLEMGCSAHLKAYGGL